MQKFLPVDCSPISDIIVTETGDPVWPIRSHAEHEALAKAAQLYGWTLAETKGHRRRRRMGRRRRVNELVLGLGREVKAEAELYAHLTGRHCQIARHHSDVTALHNAHVIVTTLPRLTAGLLEAIYVTERVLLAPGIICAQDRPTLRRVVQTRSADLMMSGHCAGPLYTNVMFGHSLAGKHWPTQEDDEFIAEIKMTLSAGAAVLEVFTHSDGLCFPLGNRALLCPMTSFALDYQEQRPPRCWIEQQCTYIPVALKSIPASTEHLSPEMIRAQILLLGTCVGVLPHDGLYGSGWGLASRYCANGSIGAIVASWKAEHVNRELFNGVKSDLRSGCSIGAAVASLNNSDSALKCGNRLCLLGDPGLAIPMHISQALRSSRPPARQMLPKHELSQITLLRLIAMEELNRAPVKRERNKKSRDHLVQTATEAFQLLLTQERAAYTGILATEQGPCGQKIRQLFLKLIVHNRTHFLGIYSKLGASSKASHRRRLCPNCRSPLTCHIYQFRLPLSPKRLITVCPRCSLVEDVPDGITIEIIVHPNGTITLSGDLPTMKWSVGICIGCQSSEPTSYNEWHDTDSSSMPDTFVVPGDMPAGPFFIAAIVLWNHDYAIVRRYARKDGSKITCYPCPDSK